MKLFATKPLVSLMVDVLFTCLSLTAMEEEQPAPQQTQAITKIKQASQHICPICNLDCRHQSELKRHLCTHTGEKPYECPICKKHFPRKSASHERMHSGEKPHECPMCQRKFTNKGALNYHIRTHTSERPYECPICQTRFIDKKSLDRHKPIHDEKRPHYICNHPNCGKTYSRKDDLKTHQKIHDKRPLEENPIQENKRLHIEENPDDAAKALMFLKSVEMTQ